MNETRLYDKIDPYLIGSKVLEIGINEKILLNSKIKDKILSVEYLGLDIVDRGSKKLPFVKADIINYEFKEKYDTIMAIEVIEHLHFRDWKQFFEKLKNALNIKGYLIITAPRNQKLTSYLNEIPKDYYQIHTVFGINQLVFEQFLPDCRIKTIRTIIWREKGESYLWAFGRLIKRMILRNFDIVRSHYLVIWQKNYGNMS